jgi:hypothetical protein
VSHIQKNGFPPGTSHVLNINDEHENSENMDSSIENKLISMTNSDLFSNYDNLLISWMGFNGHNLNWMVMG